MTFLTAQTAILLFAAGAVCGVAAWDLRHQRASRRRQTSRPEALDSLRQTFHESEKRLSDMRSAGL